ncbi:hypothetical protein NDN08_006377 [Rhodosorus marinus]|uniref:NAD-dependent epimerase/dehydratase domain-containing protein n=1 Tax=Rhodosorus marinus TaxID=101924 RepID=A0AAV8UP26_9RHOD|nr:hypothetical protein NDN08_006377 [Rhodosorus marinus]
MPLAWPQPDRLREFMKRRYMLSVGLNAASTWLGVADTHSNSRNVLYMSTAEDEFITRFVPYHGPSHSAAAAWKLASIIGGKCLERGIKTLWLRPQMAYPTDRKKQSSRRLNRARLFGMLETLLMSGIRVEANPNHLLMDSRLRNPDETVEDFHFDFIAPLGKKGLMYVDTPADIDAQYLLIDSKNRASRKGQNTMDPSALDPTTDGRND